MKTLPRRASGLVGRALIPHLTDGGHKVARLVRARPGPGEAAVVWDPDAGTHDPAPVEGFDAVIHLSGESIATGRWTEAKKARIRDSRVKSTALLAGRIERLSRPPGVLLCASAIGFYGNRGDEVLTEDSAPRKESLAVVC